MSGFRKTTKPAPSVEKQVETVQKVTSKPQGKSTSGTKYVNQVMNIVESKDGQIQLRMSQKTQAKLFIQGEDGELREVTGFITKDPLVELDKSVAAGRMDASNAEAIKEKISFILGEVTVVAE